MAVVDDGSETSRRRDRTRRDVGGDDRHRLRSRCARRRRRGCGDGRRVDDACRAHAGAHVEPHVLRARRGAGAVHRRSRDGLEHDGGVATRRRHARLHRLAAQGDGAQRRCRCGRPTVRRSRHRSRSCMRSSNIGSNARRRCSLLCGRAIPTSRRWSSRCTPTCARSCTRPRDAACCLT